MLLKPCDHESRHDIHKIQTCSEKIMNDSVRVRYQTSLEIRADLVSMLNVMRSDRRRISAAKLSPQFRTTSYYNTCSTDMGLLLLHYLNTL